MLEETGRNISMCFRPAQIEMKKCPKCGKVNKPIATVCESCGAQLVASGGDFDADQAALDSAAVKKPGVPKAPGTPAAPGAPKAPGAPSAPKAPGAPGMPGSPKPPMPGA